MTFEERMKKMFQVVEWIMLDWWYKQGHKYTPNFWSETKCDWAIQQETFVF